MVKEFLKRIVIEVIKELLSPQLEGVRQEIASLREEVGKEIARLREEVGKEIASLREEIERVDKESRARDEMLMKMISELRADLRAMGVRLDTMDTRLDRLYEVVVRREEHYALEQEVRKLRDDVEMLKRKVGV